jgi:hypothetical protein
MLWKWMRPDDDFQHLPTSAELADEVLARAGAH